MGRQLCGQGEGGTDEAGDALPERVVATLDVRGCRRVLRDGGVWRRRHDPWGDDLWVRRAQRGLAGDCRQMGPHRVRPVVTALSHGARHAVPGLLVHGEPAPWLVRLRLHAAPPLVRFPREPPAAPLPWGPPRLPLQMRRPGRKAGDAPVHEPPATDAHGTAQARPRDGLAASTFHQGARCVMHPPVGGVQATLAATRLTWMLLLPGMHMTILLEALGSTLWPCLSHDHNALLASLISVDVFGQEYHGIRSTALPV